MRNFSKKLAFVLAAAMVFTAFAPAAKAKAASEMTINRASQTLYVNEKGVNQKGSETLADGLYGNVQEYDFYVKNKPSDYAKTLKFDWTSSDEKVATVDQKGLTKAVGVGTATITCTITEKATGNKLVAAPTTKVTVKANADVVTITNADDVEGEVVMANDTVELEYKMLAEDGGKATDLVKWVADPATGVTVKDGVFTFGEDALPGDYLLYCQTYQSEKYNQVTATSEKVTVTFATSNTFEVDQDSITQFTIKFSAPVKAVGDVVVNRLYKGFELPVVIKGTPKLAEDGMSATVTLYNALKNNEEYAIVVEGYETYKLTASAGVPVKVLLFSDEKCKNQSAEYAYIDGNNNLVDIGYRLIDAKGVDVTDNYKDQGGNLFLTAEADEGGNYFVSGEKIWFANEGIDVIVEAEFQMYDNQGNKLPSATGEKLFQSMNAPATEILGVLDWKVGGAWHDKKTSLPLDETPSVALKIKLSDGSDPVEIDAEHTQILNGNITLQELNPDVAALDGYSIIYFKQGTAKILVNYTYYDENSNKVDVPLYQLNVTAKAATKLNSFSFDKPTVNIGTEAGFDTGIVTLAIKNNHGGDYTGDYVVTIEGIDDVSRKVVAYNDTSAWDVIDGNKIYFYGEQVKAANNGKDAAQITFKVKVSNTTQNVYLEKTLTVVYKSRGGVNSEYIRVEAEGFGVDVARTAKDANTKKAKVGTFSVYEFSNGIKVDTVDVLPYDANSITTGNYYFKVTKDSKDITDKFVVGQNVDGNVVTIYFSGVNAGDKNAVTYDNFGAGSYAFSLFEVVDVNGKPYARPVNGAVASGSVTCNVGSYTYAGRANEDETVANAEDATVAAMFKFKNAQGGDVDLSIPNSYTVQSNTDATDYVYVESITFYDDLVGDRSATAKYVVPIGIALKLAD